MSICCNIECLHRKPNCVVEIELVTKLMMFLCIILLSTLEMVQSKFVDSWLLVFYHQTKIISVLSPD